MNAHVTEEDVQMTNKLIKHHVEMQIKTTLRYHCTPVRMAKVKKQWPPHAGKDTEKQDPSSIPVENVKWPGHSGNKSGSFLQY